MGGFPEAHTAVQPGFVIMQIGDPVLDLVYEEAVAPALAACEVEARRVDRHNRGGLILSEIMIFIEEAEIVVADLTNERPNCYDVAGFDILFWRPAALGDFRRELEKRVRRRRELLG